MSEEEVRRLEERIRLLEAALRRIARCNKHDKIAWAIAQEALVESAPDTHKDKS